MSALPFNPTGFGKFGFFLSSLFSLNVTLMTLGILETVQQQQQQQLLVVAHVASSTLKPTSPRRQSDMIFVSQTSIVSLRRLVSHNSKSNQNTKIDKLGLIHGKHLPC